MIAALWPKSFGKLPRIFPEIIILRLRGFLQRGRFIMESSVAKHYGCKRARHCGLIANGRSQANRAFSCVWNTNCSLRSLRSDYIIFAYNIPDALKVLPVYFWPWEGYFIKTPVLQSVDLGEKSWVVFVNVAIGLQALGAHLTTKLYRLALVPCHIDKSVLNLM